MVISDELKGSQAFLRQIISVIVVRGLAQFCEHGEAREKCCHRLFASIPNLRKKMSAFRREHRVDSHDSIASKARVLEQISSMVCFWGKRCPRPFAPITTEPEMKNAVSTDKHGHSEQDWTKQAC